MSPEQAVGDREVDGRSDIYSLGVLGYQMLTGRLPFSAGNSMALLLKHVSEPPRAIAELRADAPKMLRDAVERALMKSPEDRWPTASAMRDALLSERLGPPWRAEPREPVRYTSPRPDGPRPELRAVSPRRGTPAAELRPNDTPAAKTPNEIVMEPEHLAALTPAQRDDLRLWNGRVNLLDRVNAMRGYAVLTSLAASLAIVGVLVGVNDAPPLVLGPIVPIYMGWKLRRRALSLRESGLRLLRVLLMPRARQALPRPSSTKSENDLAKLATPELLESPLGPAIRRAVEDRAAIREIAAKLPKEDRAHLKDLEPTVNGLVERVASLAQMVLRLDQSIDPRMLVEIEARIATAASEGPSPELERRLSLLRRQRATYDEILQRRAVLARQLDNAGLALGSLRLDLIKFRSSGLQSALSDVSSATQEARALSREIGLALEAAEEVRNI
jgi:serine/threonine-protein kinase